MRESRGFWYVKLPSKKIATIPLLTITDHFHYGKGRGQKSFVQNNGRETLKAVLDLYGKDHDMVELVLTTMVAPFFNGMRLSPNCNEVFVTRALQPAPLREDALIHEIYSAEEHRFFLEVLEKYRSDKGVSAVIQRFLCRVEGTILPKKHYIRVGVADSTW